MITRSETIPIAGNHLKALIARKYPGVTFLSMEIARETEDVVIFTKTAQEWIDKGRAPRSLFVMVDKKTGAVTDDEAWQDVFRGKEYNNG